MRSYTCHAFVFAIVCLSVVVLGQQAFVAKDFLLGDWQLETQKTNLVDPAAVGLAETLTWKIKDGNLTLFGTYVDEKDEERSIHVDFDSERSGRFSLALPDQDEDHVVIFEFHFENRSAGYYFSQGVWQDEHKSELGAYQFFVTSPASFILNVALKNSEGHFVEINSITGRKFVEKEPAGFLQRFGMPLVLFGVLMVSQFFKGRQAATPPSAPAGQRRREDDAEPRITEVGDDGEGEESTEATEGKKEK